MTAIPAAGPVVTQERLALLIAGFNFFPIRYVHATWLRHLSGGELMERLRPCERAHARLSAHLTAQIGLEGEYWFDFDEPVARIALLPGEVLARLVLYAGLILNGDKIRHAVGRSRVVALKQSIGAEAYEFVLKRAPFLGAHHVAQLARDGVSYSTEFREHARICGVRCLATALAEFGPALTLRLLLKLPTAWRLSFVPFPGSEQGPRTRALLTRLVSEVS